MSTNTITRPISEYRPEFQEYVRGFIRNAELEAAAVEDYTRAAHFRDLQRTDALIIYPGADGIFTIDPADLASSTI